ncbi:MAG: PIN domain-containing protein [Nanoarchaeota archaeon]
MILVVDTNILFTQFWKNSFTKNLFKRIELELFSPEYVLKEIKFHMQEILERTEISKEDFIKLREELVKMIKFVPLKEYSDFLKDALKLSVDENDIDFLASALKLNCAIWSKDPHLKQQNKIKVLTTKELIELLISYNTS